MNDSTLARWQIPECPRPVAAVLRRLPPWPAAAVLAAALNRLLASQLPTDVRERMAQRRFRIHVRDADVALDFMWTGEHFTPLPRQPQPDITLSATAPDFLRLAQRQEDPDTLFFSRRLSMQGDTELGLVVKNTLDSLELPVFPAHAPWQR